MAPTGMKMWVAVELELELEMTVVAMMEEVVVIVGVVVEEMEMSMEVVVVVMMDPFRLLPEVFGQLSVKVLSMSSKDNGVMSASWVGDSVHSILA